VGAHDFWGGAIALLEFDKDLAALWSEKLVSSHIIVDAF
jgi:hypothetical protein